MYCCLYTAPEGKYPQGIRSVFRELVSDGCYGKNDVISCCSTDKGGRILCTVQGTLPNTVESISCKCCEPHPLICVCCYGIVPYRLASLDTRQQWKYSIIYSHHINNVLLYCYIISSEQKIYRLLITLQAFKPPLPVQLILVLSLARQTHTAGLTIDTILISSAPGLPQL